MLLRGSASGAQRVCMRTAPVRLGTPQRAPPKPQQKGKTEVLTTPLSDLVFRSSFTSPKPVGVKRDRETGTEKQDDSSSLTIWGHTLPHLTCLRGILAWTYQYQDYSHLVHHF